MVVPISALYISTKLLFHTHTHARVYDASIHTGILKNKK